MGRQQHLTIFNNLGWLIIFFSVWLEINFLPRTSRHFDRYKSSLRIHGLFLSTPSSGVGGEIVWIPLRKDRLVNVLASLQ